MKTHSRWLGLVVFALSLIVCQQARAASITGKVVEVNEGDEITIFNLNRNVRIRLMAIDAPEPSQAFGAVAKQHLFDLVHDKMVSVEYWGVGQHNILIGRLLSGGNDICAQMIRDGAAWFDPASKDLLTEAQREIYFQSEQAARSERRGLWQAENVVSPWEFAKAEKLQRETTPTNKPAVSANETPKQARPTAELNSMGLLRTGSAPALGGNMSWADGSLPRTWERYQPSGQHFSAMMPEGGAQQSSELAFGEQKVETTTYLVKEGDNLYELFWMKAKVYDDSDFAVLDDTVDGYMETVKEHMEKAGSMGQCAASATLHNISLRGYTGKEFDLSQCPIPNIVRIYTTKSRGERWVFGALVVFRQKNDNVSRFLKSFTIGAAKTEGPKPLSKN
jgi:endonuclease YncB( thermonuclease family)